jgi:hypothetical protein
MALLFRDTGERERYGFVINAICILIFSFILLATASLAHPLPGKLPWTILGNNINAGSDG